MSALALGFIDKKIRINQQRYLIPSFRYKKPNDTLIGNPKMKRARAYCIVRLDSIEIYLCSVCKCNKLIEHQVQLQTTGVFIVLHLHLMVYFALTLCSFQIQYCIQ